MKSKFLLPTRKLIILLFTMFILCSTTSFAGNFYYKGSGQVSAVGSWGPNTDGSGLAPSNFTSGDVFNLRNVATIPTLTASWTVSGTGAKIVVGDGTNACSLTIPSGFTITGTIDVSNNGTLLIANATNPTLGTLATGSTVNFSSTTATGSQTIPAANYYNLTSSSTGARVLASSGNINIAGTFTKGSNTYTTTGSTIVYNGSGTQAITAFTYANLSVTNTVGPVTAGAFSFSGNFNIDPNVTLNMGTNAVSASITTTNTTTVNNSPTITITANPNITVGMPVYGPNIPLGTTVLTYSGGTSLTLSKNATGASTTATLFYNISTSGTGTLQTQVSSSGAVPACAYTFDIVYNNSTGFSTFPNGISQFNNLTISSRDGAATFGNITINGTLNVSTVLTANSVITGGSSFATSGSGILRTSVATSISATPIPSGKSYSFEVDYISTAPQTVVAANYSTLSSGVFSTSTTSTGTTNPIVVLSATGIAVNQIVTGPNIPANTTVTIVSGSNITLSNAPTASTGVAIGSVTFNVLAAATRTLASGTVAVSTSFLPGTTSAYTVTSGNTLSLGYTTNLPTLGSGIPPNLYNLTISGGTFTAPSNLTIGGSFSLSGGTFIAPSGDFTVPGNWSNTGGTFTHNSGRVVFSGTNQTISGSTNFYSLSKTVGTAAILTLPSGQTQNVAGILTLSGAASNLLTLAPSVASTTANFNFNGSSATVSYVSVSYNNNTGSSISDINGFDGGNNSGWSIVQAPTWTGANGNSNWNDALNWSTGVVPSAGAVVTVTKAGSFDLAIETSPNVASLTITTGNNVTLMNGQALTLNGTLTTDGTFTANATSAVKFAANAAIAGTGSVSFNNLTINTGVVLSGGGFSINGTFTGAGTINSTSGTVTVNGAGLQTIPSGTYQALTITNTGAVVSAAGNLTIGTNININSSATLDLVTYQLLI